MLRLLSVELVLVLCPSLPVIFLLSDAALFKPTFIMTLATKMTRNGRNNQSKRSTIRIDLYPTSESGNHVIMKWTFQSNRANAVTKIIYKSLTPNIRSLHVLDIEQKWHGPRTWQRYSIGTILPLHILTTALCWKIKHIV